MKLIKARNLHRDLGYFYIGLIISFAFSGILMNHREHWHPEKYTTETKAIQVKLPPEHEINEKYVENLGKNLGIDDKIRRHNVKKGTQYKLIIIFFIITLPMTIRPYQWGWVPGVIGMSLLTAVEVSRITWGAYKKGDKAALMITVGEITCVVFFIVSIILL